MMINNRLGASKIPKSTFLKRYRFANDLFQVLIYMHGIHLLFTRTMKEKMYSLGSSLREEQAPRVFRMCSTTYIQYFNIQSSNPEQQTYYRKQKTCTRGIITEGLF